MSCVLSRASPSFRRLARQSLFKSHLSHFSRYLSSLFHPTLGHSSSSPATSKSRSTTMVAAAALPAALEGLEPANLWSLFAELSSIPRPSKHEERVIEWLKAFAAERELECVQDGVGNLVIRRPGTGGGESAPPVIIQGHIDMVTEKNAETVHDFMTDPIRLLREDDWITADGTTLGADNGIGVCTALAVLNLPNDAKLPPIEALFTIDEETGLTGAFGLDGSMLKGRTMLNLDTEEWPEVYIGCAGGGDTVLTLNLKKSDEALSSGSIAMEISVTGLKGGHSGVDIHEDRGNAVRMASVTIEKAFNAAPNARLVSITGGDKRNAIPRECRAVVMVAHDEQDNLKNAVALVESEFKAEYGTREPDFRITVEPTAPEKEYPAVLESKDSERLLNLLCCLPHGVIKYSHSVPGLVETSNNLASVRPNSGGSATDGQVSYRIQCSTRSSIMPALERTRGAIRRLGGLVGANIEQDEAYPGWAPQPNAEIVGVTQRVIADVAGRLPQVKAIHAGLECGIIGERLPGCQSVSYGPTIQGAHSPDERVQISTVKPFWDATVKLLGQLAERK
jgi:dipeptidase D